MQRLILLIKNLEQYLTLYVLKKISQLLFFLTLKVLIHDLMYILL